MKENKHNNGHLTPAEIMKFEALLLVKRSELLGNVSFMKNEALRGDDGDLSKLPIHMADLGTDNYDQEFTLGLMDSERKLVKEIDEALDRIDNGTYGICEGSGKRIPKARLEAIPWAKYCVEYASKLEKGLIKDDSYYNNTSYDYGDDDQDDDPGEPFQRKAV
jgi:RNA polymerase-binding protein DksA